ncbi:MAG TPA: hypothetical protein VN361_08075 [Oxalicibacterium sp.]|nr:hypothetical protein [Oxalicibacterium sp.]
MAIDDAMRDRQAEFRFAMQSPEGLHSLCAYRMLTPRLCRAGRVITLQKRRVENRDR